MTTKGTKKKQIFSCVSTHSLHSFLNPYKHSELVGDLDAFFFKSTCVVSKVDVSF